MTWLKENWFKLALVILLVFLYLTNNHVIWKRLSPYLDISIALMLAGLLCIFAGTMVISGYLFKNLVAGYYMVNWGKKTPTKYKIFGGMFGIDKYNWSNVFLVSFQQSKEDIKKYKDPDSPIRAAIWFFVGTLSQIISLFV